MRAAPRFSLDENVSERVLPALHRFGLDVVTTTQLGLKGATDPRQLLVATQLGRVLVTHNGADFRMLHETLGRWAEAWDVGHLVRHAGILIIVQESRMQATTMAAIVDRLAREDEAITNRLFAWNRRQGLIEETLGWATHESGIDAPHTR